MAIISIVAGVGSTPPSGSSGGSAPNVSATATVFYDLVGHDSVFGFQGTITLPSSDPTFNKLQSISVNAYSGTAEQGTEICNFTAPFTGDTLDFKAGQFNTPTDSSQDWNVEFICYDENGVPTVNPYTVQNITVEPAKATAVTAQEKLNGRVANEDASVTTTIQVTPSLASIPQTVTVYLSFDNGASWRWQGWWFVTTPGQVIEIADQYPSTHSDETWKAAIVVGAVDGGYSPMLTSLPAGSVQSAGFSVPEIASVTTSDCTDAQFLDYPGTSSLMNYWLTGPGIWVWMWYGFQITLPTEEFDPNFWFCAFTVQKVDSSGNPAPDYEGVNESPYYIGRQFTDSGNFTGGIAGYGQTITVTSDANSWWTYPPVNDQDGNPNPYRTFRIRAYAASRKEMPDGTPGLRVLQNCWPGGADHFDLTPSEQPAALDLSQVNTNTLSDEFKVASGKFTINQLDSQKLTNLESIDIGSFSGTLDASHITNLGAININSFTGNLDASHVTNLGAINIGSLSGNLDASHVTNLGAINIGSLTGNLDASKISNLGAINITSLTGNLDASHISNLSAINITSLSGTLDVSKVANLDTISISSFTGTLDASKVANLSTIPISTFMGTLDASKVANLDSIPISTFQGNLDASKVANLGSIPISTFQGNLDASKVANLNTISISTFAGSLDASKVANLNTVPISTFGGQLSAGQIGTVTVDKLSGVISSTSAVSVNTNALQGVIITSQLADQIINSVSKIGSNILGYGVTSDGSTIRLGTTDTSNISQNPDFEYDTKDWTVGGGVTVTTAVKYTGTKSLQIVGVNQAVNNAAWTTCKPGDQFILQSYVRAASGATGYVNNLIRFFDINNNPVTPNSDGPWGQVSASDAINTWKLMQTGISTAPANAAWVQIYAIWTGGSSNSTWYLDNVVLKRAVDSSMISSINLTTTTFNGILAAGYAKVNATDINGQITASQIQSVNASSINGSISASQISTVNASSISGQISAQQIGTVYANSISGQLNYNQIGSINASTINIGQISDGQISGMSAGKLTAGTVNATIAMNSPQINGGTITGSSISITVLSTVTGNCIVSVNPYATGIKVQNTLYGASYGQLTDGSLILSSYSGSYAFLTASSLYMNGSTIINNGQWTGQGVSCPSYTISGYSLQAGYGGVYTNGSQSINSSNQFVGAGVQCPYNGVGASGFNVYSGGWNYGASFYFNDQAGTQHRVIGGILVY